MIEPFIPIAVALGAAALAAGVVFAQLRALGLGPGFVGWPPAPWRVIATQWAAWTAFAATLTVLPGLPGPAPQALFSWLLQLGAGLAIVAGATWVGHHLGDEGPVDRRMLLLAAWLLATMVVAPSAMGTLVFVVALVVLWLGSRPEGQAALARTLADLSAGMRLRSRRLIGKDLDLGGIPIKVERVGLLASEVDEGAGRRTLGNEEVLALVDQAD